MRSLPCERYEFTLCDERTPQIRCIACRRGPTGALQIATGGQELKLWTQTTTTSEQLTYAAPFLEKLTLRIKVKVKVPILVYIERKGLELIRDSRQSACR